MDALELHNLSKAYGGGARVLRDLSLGVAPGERFALVGPSGSGKTTLLRVVAGLEDADAGDVRLNGRSVLRLAAEARGVGLVFQTPLLFPHLSVRDNVAFGLLVRGVPRKDARRRAHALLERVGLADLGARKPHRLSGGQAQRAALARALAPAPAVLLLDEPFAALDAPLRRELRAWLADLLASEGTTALLVTHDQEEALTFGQRVGVLLGGELPQVASPREVFTRPVSVEVARFLGGVNFVAGEQRGREVRTALGVFRVPVARSGPVTLTFRPEALREGAGSVNTLRGHITRADFAGTAFRCEVSAGGTALVWLAPPYARAEVGAEVTWGVAPEDCWTMPHGVSLPRPVPSP